MKEINKRLSAVQTHSNTLKKTVLNAMWPEPIFHLYQSKENYPYLVLTGGLPIFREHEKHNVMTVEKAGEPQKVRVRALLEGVTRRIPGLQQYIQFVDGYQDYILDMANKVGNLFGQILRQMENRFSVLQKSWWPGSYSGKRQMCICFFLLVCPLLVQPFEDPQSWQPWATDFDLVWKFAPPTDGTVFCPTKKLRVGEGVLHWRQPCHHRDSQPMILTPTPALFILLFWCVFLSL